MMKSLVVVALLALLPLAASLPTCQSSTTDKFLNMEPLNGGVLGYFYQNWMWSVASAGQDVNKQIMSTEIKFDKPVGTTITGTFQYRTSKRPNAPIWKRKSTRFTVERSNNREYALTHNKSVKVYFFKCSDNMIGGYRCKNNAESGSTDDPEYFILANWDVKEADATKELQSCVAKFGLGNSVTFQKNYHP